MDRAGVDKWFFLLSVGLMILTGIEIIIFIVFSTAIEITVDSQQFTIMNLIFTSGLMNFDGGVLWVVILITTCTYFVICLILCRIARKKKLADKVLGKSLLVLGVVLIMTAFMKMVYISLLARTEITPPSIDFQTAVLTSPLAMTLWLYIIAVTCGFLLVGLIFGAMGIKWFSHVESLEPKVEETK